MADSEDASDRLTLSASSTQSSLTVRGRDLLSAPQRDGCHLRAGEGSHPVGSGSVRASARGAARNYLSMVILQLVSKPSATIRQRYTPDAADPPASIIPPQYTECRPGSLGPSHSVATFLPLMS